MENCTTGISITTTEEICGGKYTSTDCTSIPNNITYLDVSAGDSQTEVNAALVTALMYKDEQIASIPIQDGSETKIVAGDNVTVTGEGTIAAPYIVDSIDSRPYKVYSAMMNQIGVGSLNVTNIMENTLGEILWSRESTGLFYGRLDGIFIGNKTLCFANQGYITSGVSQPISISHLTDDFIQINCIDDIKWFSIEIRVYN